VGASASLPRGVLPAQSWVGHELNCGFNRVRFVSPVCVGAEVRATARLVKVTRLGGEGGGGDGPVGVESVVAVTVHVRGHGVGGNKGRDGEGEKPVLVAEWVTRQYAKTGCAGR